MPRRGRRDEPDARSARPGTGRCRAGPGGTGDKFTTDRILTPAFEADLDGLFFAFIVANLAGRMLVQACGSEAQAAALVDDCINGLVRDRARAASLHLDLGLVPGFGLASGFGLGLGFPLDPRGVFAAARPFGVLRCEALCGLVGPREQFGLAASAGRLTQASQALAHLPGWPSESAQHPARVWMAGSARVCAAAARAPRRRWRPGAGVRWRVRRLGGLLRTRATIRPSSDVRRRAGPGVLSLAGRVRAA